MTADIRSPLGPVQKALYLWLSNDLALAQLATVYDYIPEATPYPYVEIGQFSATKDDTSGDAGRDVTAIVQAYSQNPGFLELQGIQQELLRLLDGKVMPNDNTCMPPSSGWAIWNNMVIHEELVKLPTNPVTSQLTLQVLIQVSSLRDLP